MKNYFTFLLLLLVLPGAYAHSLFDQLCAYNDNWKKYAELAPAGAARIFPSDQSYVQTHLKHVLTILELNPGSHLNEQQYASRMHLLDLLSCYREEGNFPRNYNWEERTPVFIDPHNTHCAVGYLMQGSGHGAMAAEIASSQNYAWLKNIHHPNFAQWQQASGFSLEELKLIQGAYEFYRPDAMILPNRHEIPQKPAVIARYFEEDPNKKTKDQDKLHVWCYGEGKDGILHGSWIQNYAVGIPWIAGYFDQGKRTGQWKEYYQGTNQLCRTENWRNNQLNGVRKRFDRGGNLIEEILFRNGKAVTKTNYDFGTSLKWIRQPLDSGMMQTTVYTFGGALIAEGKEKVHNPGNLEWFQNIPLTALNSASITSKQVSQSTEAFSGHGANFGRQSPLYNTPPLVEYKKEGKWIYYKEMIQDKHIAAALPRGSGRLRKDYFHFGDELFQSIQVFKDWETNLEFDAIEIIYSNDYLLDFYGFGKEETLHLSVRYYPGMEQESFSIYPDGQLVKLNFPRRIKEMGQYNALHQKIGPWKCFNKLGELYKTAYYAKQDTCTYNYFSLPLYYGYL